MIYNIDLEQNLILHQKDESDGNTFSTDSFSLKTRKAKHRDLFAKTPIIIITVKGFVIFNAQYSLIIKTDHQHLPVTGSSFRFTDSISPNLSKYSFSCTCSLINIKCSIFNRIVMSLIIPSFELNLFGLPAEASNEKLSLLCT